MKNDAKKYYLISAILLGSAFFGITPITVKFIAEAILSNPPADTSGRATVNIAIALSMVLSIIVSIVCAIIGIIKSRSVKK